MFRTGTWHGVLAKRTPPLKSGTKRGRSKGVGLKAMGLRRRLRSAREAVHSGAACMWVFSWSPPTACRGVLNTPASVPGPDDSSSKFQHAPITGRRQDLLAVSRMRLAQPGPCGRAVAHGFVETGRAQLNFRTRQARPPVEAHHPGSGAAFDSDRHSLDVSRLKGSDF